MVPAISVPVTPSLKRVIAVSNKNTNIYGACVLVPVKTLWAPGRCRHQDGCWRYALPRQGDFLFFFFFCQYPIIWKWQHKLIVMDMKIPCVLGCTITKMTKYYTKRSNNWVFNFLMFCSYLHHLFGKLPHVGLDLRDFHQVLHGFHHLCAPL